MRWVMCAAVVCLFAAAVLGCKTTPPPRYYTLDMTPSGAVKAAYGIEVERIRASEPLARRDILIKKSPTEVEYYARDQWAADPGQLVTEKLSAEFGHRRDADKHVRLVGEVLAFEQVDAPGGTQAHLKLDIEFRVGDMDLYDEPVLKKTYESAIPVADAGPGAVVKALSDGLEQTAALIAADADGL